MGLGFRDGLGFRVFRVQGLGLKVLFLRIRGENLHNSENLTGFCLNTDNSARKTAAVVVCSALSFRVPLHLTAHHSRQIRPVQCGRNPKCLQQEASLFGPYLVVPTSVSNSSTGLATLPLYRYVGSKHLQGHRPRHLFVFTSPCKQENAFTHPDPRVLQ